MDIPTEDEVLKAEIDHFRTECLEMYTRRGGHYPDTSDWLIKYENGDRSLQTGRICHSGLNRGTKGALFVISSLLQRIKNRGLSLEEETTYLHYLIHEGQFSEAFLIRDVQWCLDNHMVVMRTDVHGEIMTSAIVATRAMWEHEGSIKLFSALVNRGMDKGVANVLSLCFREFREEGKFWVGHNQTNHCVLNPLSRTHNEVKRFLLNTPDQLKLVGHYRVDGEYKGIQTLWSGQDRYQNADFGAAIEKIVYKNPKEDKEKELNPFAVCSQQKFRSFTLKQLTKILLDNWKKIHEDILNAKA